MSTKERVKRIYDEIHGVASLYEITSWEIEFLSSIENRESLTEKQERILGGIEEKAFGEQDE